jgi:hypothetical protein
MARASPTVTLPKSVVEELYDASIRFMRAAETLEVLLDKETVRRIKLGKKQHARGQYVVAKSPAEIRKALSS